MRVVIINNGEVVKTTPVKEKAHIVVSGMWKFMSEDTQGREIALVDDDSRELVRLVNDAGSVEARLPVSNLMGILKRASKARHFEDLFNRAMASREEESER